MADTTSAAITFCRTFGPTVLTRKQWGDIDGNVISYSYVPKFSEYHMMKPVQVNKQKKTNLCGYVMLFKKTKNDAGASNLGEHQGNALAGK